MWDPKYYSLVKYSLGEPKFVSRRVHSKSRKISVVVNMSQNFAPSIVDYDQIFPDRLAKKVSHVGSSGQKWSKLAIGILPVLQLDTVYFQTVLPKENSGSQRLKIINETIPSQEIEE
jgi:hypothetical protein